MFYDDAKSNPLDDITDKIGSQANSKALGNQISSSSISNQKIHQFEEQKVPFRASGFDPPEIESKNFMRSGIGK